MEPESAVFVRDELVRFEDPLKPYPMVLTLTASVA